jgi:ferric-dicitrate binding protein FerR (iron transport regulator)
MTINRKHIDSVFSQRFSLLDLKMTEKYFEDERLNEEARLVLKEQWEQFKPGAHDQADLNDVFYKLYYTINSPALRSPRKKDIFLKIAKVAAVLLLCFLTSAVVYFFNQRSSGTANEHLVEIVSHEGFRSQFKLPDGTTGWLGYGSKLKYSEDQKGRRIIALNGLAFFDVAHKKSIPFIVKTPAQLDIEVLGTRFNVSAYSDDSSFDVVLQTGSVKLNMANGEVQTMKPNERIVYCPARNSIRKIHLEKVDDFLAWKEGRLILKDISIKEACIKLSRFYNVDFDLRATGLDNLEIQLTLEKETLEDALHLLTMISPASYQIEERKVQNNQAYSRKKVIIKNK